MDGLLISDFLRSGRIKPRLPVLWPDNTKVLERIDFDSGKRIMWIGRRHASL